MRSRRYASYTLCNELAWRPSSAWRVCFTRAATTHQLQTVRQHAHARSDRVTHMAEYFETLGLSPARGGRIGHLPAELQTATRWDRAARIADRDDDVPPFAHTVDR